MSKTRVNLFSPELLPAKLRLSFAKTVSLSLLLVLLGAVALILGWWQQQTLQQQLQTVQQQNAALEQQKTALQQALAKHQPDSLLQQQVTQLTQEHQLKSLLLTELDKREQFKSVGFTDMLQELAQVADGSIWLSHIQFEPPKLLFEGYTLKPENVPHWVARLSHTDSFQGKAFASMTMNRGEHQPLAFKLTTDSKEADKK
ncbi:PilN domain-containing protein [Shewanella sp. A32]|uniref:PilN domain-containing protein n=1 Tax=Shewanella sp. A32 TaxID=3031327 RepID=UPI0023B95DF9|nr:PilN domain-containing protein [Shewanella sp. A32]MDF0535222.1 PilN domain-containing protein [Shewanella sp. A32]